MSRRTKGNLRTLRDVPAAGVANINLLTFTEWSQE